LPEEGGKNGKIGESNDIRIKDRDIEKFNEDNFNNNIRLSQIQLNMIQIGLYSR